ncbi:hypothetical protein BH10ACT7_BH10ACT7_14730 [soil metagenome]
MSEIITPQSSPSEEGEAAFPRPLRFASHVGAIASLSILALAVLLTVEVISRSLFHTSIRGLYEIAELLVVVVVFLGIAQAEVARNHVRVTIVTDRLPQRLASAVRGVALILAGGFLGWMFVALSVKAWESFESHEFKVGLLNFPIWPSRVLVAFGIGLLVYVCLYKGVGLLLAGVRSRKSEGDADVR